MADVAAEDFANSVAAAFATSASNTSFASDLVRAINASINDINQRGDQTSQIDRVSSLEGSIGVDEDYEDMLLNGCIYHLTKRGRRFSASDTKAVPSLSEWRAIFNESIGQYYMDVVNDVDTTTTDLIGLGAPSY